MGRESNEPFYVAQTADAKTPDERLAWARERAAFVKGLARHVRISFDDTTGVTLFEAWETRPRDEGEPRFGMVKQ